jgi:HK97 family phage major capsid protein
MKSQDTQDFAKKIADAVQSGEPELFGNAMQEYGEAIQDAIMHDIEGKQQERDVKILKARGKNELTAKEVKFYDALRESIVKEAPIRMAIGSDSYTNTLPETIIDRIFDDLAQEHPLLGAVQLQNTTGLTKMYVNGADTPVAAWGDLTGTITKELVGKFIVTSLQLYKLSAFIPVPLSMLDVGYERLDQYVRTLLTESIAYGCEEGIINGTGKYQPIGMIKQVGEGVSVTSGVYPDKSVTKVTDLDATTLGALVAKITQSGKRQAKNLGLIVNAGDYYEKIMPATTLLSPNGSYVSNVLPIPNIAILPSVQMAAGKAVIGDLSKYFFGVGAGTDGGRLEFSDQYQFLEDNRVYKIKMYANGQALDNDAFQYLDISKLNPLVYSVKNITTTTTTSTTSGS